MAVRTYTIKCDYCGEETDEYENDHEANEFGWYILWGPERDLGGNGERAYCSNECLANDL